MHTNQKISKIELTLMILMAVVLSLIVLEYANPNIYPPGRDGGAYMFGGRHVLHGKTLYVDYWEAKGPLIFFINAFGLLISGDSRWGIWLVELLFWALAAILGLLTLKKPFSALAGIAAVTVMMLAGRRLVGYGNFTEEYSLLFTWVALLAFFHLLEKPSARHNLIILGAMFALNFFVRANNVLTVSVLILLWVGHAWRTKSFKDSLGEAALIAAGGLFVTLPIAAYFLLQGTFIDMLIAAIFYNFSYSLGTRPGMNPLNIIANAFSPALGALGIWMLLPLLGWVAAVLRLVQQLVNKRVDIIMVLLAVTWPLEMLAASISGRSYGHYFLTWLPIMALLTAFALDTLKKLLLPRMPVKSLPASLPAITLGLTTLLLPGIFNQPMRQYGQALSALIRQPAEQHVYIHPISAFIAENTQPDERVLVWGGQTGMLFMSNRFSSTAYNFYPLYANSRIGRDLQQRYFADLQNNPPTLILDAHIHAPDYLPSINPQARASQRLIYPIAENHAAVLDYINANYHLILDENGYQVYQINPP